MTDQPQFFFCYSKRVSDFLTKEGVGYVTVAKDPKTEKLFSLYVINDDLQNALDKYKNNK